MPPLRSTLSGSIRTAAFIISAFPLLGAQVATAQGELLDPARLKKQAPSPERTELLAPPASPRDKIAPEPGGGREANEVSAGDCRQMAATVVTSLQGLIQSAGNLVATIKKMDTQVHDLESKKHQQIKAKELEMAEYRAGQFCSGCDLTKSEILAKGETFPHPGETIEKPTAEQIAEKDRELQGPIDKTLKELREARIERDNRKEQLREAVQQTEWGIKLWTTAAFFEGLLNNRVQGEAEAKLRMAYAATETQIATLNADIAKQKQTHRATLARSASELTRHRTDLLALERDHQSGLASGKNEMLELQTRLEKEPESAKELTLLEMEELKTKLAEATEAYRKSRAALETTIAGLQPEELQAKHDLALARLEKDLAFWTSRQHELEVKYEEALQAHKRQRADTATALASGLKSITDALTLAKLLAEHPYLGIFIQPNFASYVGVYGSFIDQGGRYRMGDYTVNRRGEVLPGVRSFVTAYSNSRWYRGIDTSAPQSTPPPPRKPRH